MGEPVRSAETDEVLQQLTQREGRADPYPRYEVLRRTAPIAEAPDGAYVLTRYADCHAVMQDPHFGRSDPGRLYALMGMSDWESHPGMWMLSTSMLVANPPVHTRLRRLVSSAFTPRHVARLRPVISALVDDLLPELEGEVDFVSAFAFPLPVAVIGELLGVPRADQARFQPLVRDWTLLLDTFTPGILKKADDAAVEIRSYLADHARERRRQPREDLISALVATEPAGDRLTEDELLTMGGLLFSAGFETTTHLLANGLVALLDNPAQLRLLRDQPELGAQAAEEVLRYDSSVQIGLRTALSDTSIADVPVQAGHRVVTYLGAANRDPARFRDPDRLDVQRADNGPLSFGGGIHYCLGAPLARLETSIALPEMVARYRDITHAGDPDRRDSLTLRGYLALPMAFAA